MYEEIYILMSCDETKSNESRKIRMATTDLCVLYAWIFAELKEGKMLYKSDNTENSIRYFKEDVENIEVNLDCLKYGIFQSVYDVCLENICSYGNYKNLNILYNEIFGYENNKVDIDCDNMER